MQVLVVDDDELVRAFLSDALESLGHQACAAADGFDAVCELRAHPQVNLVLLDIKMPFVDGIAVLRKMKAMRPSLKVVMITAYVDDEILRSTLAQDPTAAADGFIAKPISMEALEDCLEMVCGRNEKYIASTPAMAKLARRHIRKRRPPGEDGSGQA